VRLATGLASFIATVAVASTSIAEASTAVQFRASFSPDRPGQRTSAAFDIKISSTNGGVPPPLIAARVRYPAGLAIALSGLGVDACSRLTLEELGIHGCAAGSIMGEGTATAAIEFGPELVRESAVVTLVRSPEEHGQLAMLFLVNAEEPVYATPVMTGSLSPAPAPYGGEIDIGVPLVESLPGAPDVSVVQIRLRLGPQGLVYYEHVGGRFIPYRPLGLRLPGRCPPGGFPFALGLRFQGGSSASASATVPCPNKKSPSR
jgi:hypothetical protein